ncbi:hypothetical protein ANO11243_070470 [Dothideomycetidae sp. 11243]|nr:hypothetical protein ANO11243_070470 [fungal sp. No.11243]
MSTTKTAPATHSQPSRKGKKAWRKNVDLSEVQTGLEEAREELIQGGIIAEKPSEELFVLDTTGSDQIKKKHLKDSKLLKADEIIAARASAIAPVDSRKRKSLDIARADKSKRSRKDTYVPQAEVMRLRAAGSGPTSSAIVVADSSADHDPWAVQPKVQDPQFSFLEEVKPIREPETLKHKPVSLAASGKPFAAVRRPHAGKSYNPSFDDWNASVTKLGAKEVAAERKRRADAAAEAEAEAKALAEAAKPAPPTDDEYESAWESEWEGIKSETEEQTPWLAKKRPERKTPAERNKIARRKKAESAAKHEERTKRREVRHRLALEAGKGKGEKQVAVASAAGLDSSDESGEEETLRRRPFGKNTIPEAPLEVILADELQDSLRALRPEGNLLADRYRNLLVNGKVEVRRAITQPKKPRREVTEKWSYKDWTLR